MMINNPQVGMKLKSLSTGTIGKITKVWDNEYLIHWEDGAISRPFMEWDIAIEIVEE